MKAVIRIDVPEYQKGEPVNIIFKDTMLKRGICESEKEVRHKTNEIISHLQIIHTWAAFAYENDQNFFNRDHYKHIADWTEDALNLLKEG